MHEYDENEEIITLDVDVHIKPNGDIFYKNHRYFGEEVDIVDLADSERRYARKILHFKDGFYKVYSCNKEKFRIPVPKAYTLRKYDEDDLTDKDDGEEENGREELDDKPRERKDVLWRAKQRVEQLVLLNDYTYFLTITFGDGIDARNVKEVMPKMRNWLQNQAARKGLEYVLIPEYHKDGRIHAHALINDKLDLVDSGTRMVKGYNKPVSLDTIHRKKISESQIRCTVYNVPAWRYGFSTAIPVDGNRLALANYVTKYVTKGSEKIFGRYYWCSRNQEMYPATEYVKMSPYAFYDLPGKEYWVRGSDCRYKYENHVTVKIGEEVEFFNQVNDILKHDWEVTGDDLVRVSN